MIRSLVAYLLLALVPQAPFSGGRSGAVAATAGGGGSTPALVHQAAVLVGSPSDPFVATQALGFTAAAGNALFCLQSGNNSGSTEFTSMSVSDGSSSTAMTLAASSVIGGRVETNFAFLPNLPSGINSVIIQLNNQLGTSVGVICYEFSGVSHTAAVTNVAVTSQSDFVSVNTWTTGAYAATGGGIVFSGSTSNYANASSPVWGAGSGWTMPTSTPCTAAFGGCAMLQYIVGGSGSITPMGTYSGGSSGTFYASFIVEIK